MLLAIGGLVVLAMITVSCYGAAVLPADARIPVHWLGRYGSFVSKRAGLIMWPTFGVLFMVLLAVADLGTGARDRLAGAIMLVIAMGVLLAFQAGAVIAAVGRNAQPPRG